MTSRTLFAVVVTTLLGVTAAFGAYAVAHDTSARDAVAPLLIEQSPIR